MIYPHATLAVFDMPYHDMARYDISLRQKISASQPETLIISVCRVSYYAALLALTAARRRLSVFLSAFAFAA